MSAATVNVPKTAAGPRHYPALDGLRGLAILLVIPHNSDVFDGAGCLFPMAVLAHAGWIGVQLFFVLSGFLITGNLLDSRDSNNYYRAFFARRVLRILPLYYGVLIVVLLLLPRIVHLSSEGLASQQHQIWLWTFLNNWTQPFVGNVQGFPHFWSLAVEEQFYLLWPFLAHRIAGRRIGSICAALMLIALAIRAWMLWSGAPNEAIYMFTFCRMDALAAGAACAVLVRDTVAMQFFTRHSSKVVIGAFGILAIAASITNVFEAFQVWTLTIGQTFLSLAFALAMLAAVVPGKITGTYQRLLSVKALRSIGKYSYAMYVFHMLIILSAGSTMVSWLKARSGAYPLLYSVCVVAFSYAAAFASYHLYEKHFLRLKRYFVPDRVKTARVLVAEH